MKRFYLDTSVYPNLKAKDVQCITRMIRDARCLVYGSIEILEELVLLVEKLSRPKLIRIFWEITESRVIEERRILFPMEIRRGAKLPLRLLLIQDSNALRHLYQETSFNWLEYIEKLKERRSKALNSFEDSRTRLEDQLLQSCASHSEARTRLKMDDVDEDTIEDWHSHLFDKWPDSDGNEANKWRPSKRTPLTRSWAAFMRVKISKVHKRGAKYDPGDWNDFLHYAFASMVGRWVTEDTRSREIAIQLGAPPLSLSEFLAHMQE